MKNKYFIFLLTAILFGCSPRLFKRNWTTEIAPEIFMTRFETSKGIFEIRIQRNLSPNAADRFYQMVKHQYFDGGIFYRVVPEFVVQFGNNNKAMYDSWDTIKVHDEPVLQGNTKGTLSFARSGKESRTTDLFINLVDNTRLDTITYNDVKGFPSFGKVTKGMDVVEALYSGYSGKTMDTLNLMYTNEKRFFRLFPKLDRIHKVYLIEN